MDQDRRQQHVYTPTRALLPGSTCVVSREPGRIRRVHPPSATVDDGRWLSRLIDVLRTEGVPVPRMLGFTTGEAGGRLTTYWEDVGEPAAIRWRGAGEALKRLHSIPLAALEGLALPDLRDIGLYMGLLAQFTNRSAAEGRLLRQVEHEVKLTFAQLTRHPDWGRTACLVHDDLAPHNMLTDTTKRTWLLDWDNAAVASPVWDLAFVARAVSAGKVSHVDASLFETGYGGWLPDAVTARSFGVLHRARWVLSLVARVRAGDERAGGLLADESLKWESGQVSVNRLASG